MAASRHALLFVLAAGCTPPQSEVSPDPIPVMLAQGSVGLYASGSSWLSGPAPAIQFSMLIDTGTVLTTVNLPGPSQIIVENVRLFDDPGTTGNPTQSARAEFDQVPVLEEPIYDVGVGANLMMPRFGGVLGGDLLQNFSLELSYGPNPTIALKPPELACSCALANAGSCAATLPFVLAGGGSLAVGDAQSGYEVHGYPPTRVTLDACAEPPMDPLAAGVPCLAADGTRQPAYQVDTSPGVDLKLLVATGFSGMLLGASAYDRLRGNGAAAALLAGPGLVDLHFSGHADAIKAATATLGIDPLYSGQPGAGLVLVGREGLLGGCGELARSRRLRYRAAHPKDLNGNNDPYGYQCDGLGSSDCPPADARTCLQCVTRTGSGDQYDDRNQPAAAFVELDGALPIYVVDDGAFVLQEVNFDVQPQLPAVEGIVGTSLLSRLAVRIDYPNHRVIARCADGSATCNVFPRYACYDQVSDCGPRGLDSKVLCNDPSLIQGSDAGTQCSPPP